jgi:hypothetical protein
VATANAGTLRELRARHGVCLGADLSVPDVWPLSHSEALLRAAPQLRALYADVEADSAADACLAFSVGEGLLAPLRIHGLRLSVDGDEDDVLALTADIASHEWLQELCLFGALPTLAALDAVVDAVLARPHMACVQFMSCGFTPASAPALARLLGGSAVADVFVVGDGDLLMLLDVPSAAQLAGALRTNTTLTSLQLSGLNFWEDVAAADTLLGALTAHPSLRTLILTYNPAQTADRAAAGAALRSLLAANAPALTQLNVSESNLGNVGMRALIEALPANSHLCTLNCSENGITEAFATNVLLPAVRANASLRALVTSQHFPAEREAEEVVARRTASAH